MLGSENAVDKRISMSLCVGIRKESRENDKDTAKDILAGSLKNNVDSQSKVSRIVSKLKL